MPKILDTPHTRLDGQNDFSGGMNQLYRPANTQFQYAENIVIRDGQASTRPAIRRAFANDAAGVKTGFYFNEDEARYNDATHNGFWFPWQFVQQLWGGNIQGAEWFRFPSDGEPKLIFASRGIIYLHRDGFAETVPSEEPLTEEEEVRFIQANNQIVLLRSETKTPMIWDGEPEGFFLVSDPPASFPPGDPREGDEQLPDAIPNAADGAYAFGRLWLHRDRDDVYVSDILDFSSFDYVQNLFRVNRGDGDEIIRLLPWHDDTVFVFKKGKRGGGSIYAVVGANRGQAKLFDPKKLEQQTAVISISTTSGLVGRDAVTTVGEQIWYLAEDGVNSVQRNAQGNFDGIQVPVSAPIQPLIDRINWASADGAQAISFNNYVLFAVPMDGYEYNNAVLVFDKMLNSGQGAWCGLWRSRAQILSPVRFFVVGENLYALNFDGVVRKLFVENHWFDSNQPQQDTPRWDTSRYYFERDIVYRQGSIFECQIQNSGKDPVGPDSDSYWEILPDEQNIFYIETEILSREFDFEDEVLLKALSKGELIFDHQNCSFDISLVPEGPFTEEVMFESQEYSNVQYDIADVPDWDPSNQDLNSDDPYREDYTVFVPPGPAIDTGEPVVEVESAPGVPDGGILCSNTLGVTVGTRERHSVRWMKPMIDSGRFALRVCNSRGWFSIVNVRLAAEVQRFGHRRR